MIPLTITMNIALDPWVDVPEEALVNRDGNAHLERIGLLPDGTTSGHPVAGMLLRLPDGRYVTAETTWRLLRNAVRALAAAPVAQLADDEDGMPPDDPRGTFGYYVTGDMLWQAHPEGPPHPDRPVIAKSDVADDGAWALLTRGVEVR